MHIRDGMVHYDEVFWDTTLNEDNDDESMKTCYLEYYVDDV